MTPGPPPPVDANEEIPALIQTLLAAERRLVELTGGEVDAVTDGEGRTFLLRSAQEQLRAADAERQSAILNALPAHIALLDTQGCIISVNEGWRQFGRANVIQCPGYGVGLNYLEVCENARGNNSAEAVRVAEGIRSVMNGREKSYSLEYPCHSPTEQRWFLLSVTPLADDRRVGAVVMHLNITERMQADKTRLLLTNIVESSNDAIIGESLEGVVTSWNRGAERIFGYTAEEMIGRSMEVLLPLDCRDEDRVILDRVSQGDEVSQVETRRVRKDGAKIHVLATVSPIKDANGKIVGVSKIGRDITERKQLETDLVLRERQLNSFFAGASAGLALFDKKLRFVRINETLAEINGVPAARHLGRTLQDIVPRLAAVLESYLFQVLVTGKPILDHELTGETPRQPGVTCHWIVSYFPIAGKDGVPECVGVIVVEITGQKRTEKALRESEVELRALAESMPQLVWKSRPDGWNVYFNQHWFDYTGLTLAESSGHGWMTTFHPDDRPHAQKAWKNAIETGAGYHSECRLRDWNGAYRWFLIQGVAQRDESGAILWWFGTCTDIEEQKRTVAALQRQHTEFRALFDLVPAMIWFKDTENGIVRVNQRVAEAAGKSIEEIEGKPSAEIYPEQAARYYEDDLQVIQSGVPKLGIVEQLHDQTGKILWVQTDKVPVSDKDGTVVGVVVMAQDISDRKNAEDALREKDALARIAGRITRTGGWAWEISTQHLFWSDEIFDLLDFPRGCVPSLTEVLALYGDRWRASTTAAMEACTNEGTSFDLEVEIFTAKRRLIWVRVCGEAERRPDGSIMRVQGAFQDISSRKQADLRLKLQHEVTAVLAEAASTTDINLKILEILCAGMHWEVGGLWLVDRRANALRCAEISHPASTGFAGFATVSRSVALKMGESVVGAVWASGQSDWSFDVAHDDRFQRRAEIANLQLNGWIAFPIRIREEVLGVAEFFTKKMEPPDADTLAMLAAIGAQIGIFIERRQLAEQFREAQKMEAIGTLAGGIAHDFNNILAAINGYAELSRLVLTQNPEVRNHLGAILQAAGRATHLVRQILTFSRQQKLERRTIQLLPVLAESLALLRSTIPSTIEFETSLPADAPTVLADATQIHQILMNLGTNAWHAMKNGIGLFKVSLERYVVDAAQAATHPRLRPGVYARVTVSDSGSGMDHATQQRIFEPFFTTKPPGEGTGLGLAVVHGIMDSHEGVITVLSQIGKGTVFHLYFPAHSDDTVLALLEEALVPRGRGERILFVDDEQLLVLLGRKVLEALGYSVETTTLPMEALALVRADPQRFAMVITDQTMPILTGLALASQLQEIRPGLPVILTTGYSQSLTSEGVDAAGLRQVLVKPFTIHSLGNAVHAVFSPS